MSGAATVTATSVYVNLATPDAADAVAATDADGGLLRAEFMITEALAGEHPAHMIAQGRRGEYVEKMAEGVPRIAAAFTPRPVVYRAIDLRSRFSISMTRRNWCGSDCGRLRWRMEG